MNKTAAKKEAALLHLEAAFMGADAILTEASRVDVPPPKRIRSNPLNIPALLLAPVVPRRESSADLLQPDSSVLLLHPVADDPAADASAQRDRNLDNDAENRVGALPTTDRCDQSKVCSRSGPI